MSRSIRLLPFVAAAAIFCTSGSGQRRTTFPEFPPDIWDNRSVDVVKIAPDRYAIDLENGQMRVLRARIPGYTRVAIHQHRPGLLVALTAVHLRFTRPDGAVEEIHIPAGTTRWLTGGVHSEENLQMAPCEFLFIESRSDTSEAWSQ